MRCSRVRKKTHVLGEGGGTVNQKPGVKIAWTWIGIKEHNKLNNTIEGNFKGHVVGRTLEVEDT